MRYISEYERHETKLRKIKNWLTLLAFGIIFIGLQGFYPFADLETLFLLMTGIYVFFGFHGLMTIGDYLY